MGRINSALEHEILNQRAHWFNWSPVFLAFGVGAYFELPNEPNFSQYIWISTFALCVIGVFIFSTIAYRVVFGAILIVCLGFFAAAFRANQVSAPVLKYRYYGPIEGRIIAIDKSSSDALRITLDEVKMGKISSGRTPNRVRLSLLFTLADQNFNPGSIIQATGFMMPPQSPVEPDGFDFRRHAWFFKTWCSWVYAQARYSIAASRRNIGFSIIQIPDEIFQKITKEFTRKDFRICSGNYDR